MPLTAGIVGLPNVGKSTLFNAVTNSQVLAANYPFATIQPNKGTVEVKDARLLHLTKLFNSEKTIYATFEFTDIAGLVKGASKGEGLGNQFLANIREVDAICHVVRCFEDNDVLHVDGNVDPDRDVETINIELIFADLDTVEKRLSRIAKKALATKDKEALAEVEVLNIVKSTLEAGKAARVIEFSKEQMPIVNELHLLTIKPVIYIGNVSESDLTNPEINPHYIKLIEIAKAEKAEYVAISAKIEADLAMLPAEEKELFLKELGASQSGLDKVIKAAFKTLGLATYLTAGPKESRAWTFKKGMSAPKCAGVIHTDFERGFIKAEIYSYEDLIKYGTESSVKDNGRFRVEGKDYIMQDGDIVHFRFNV
jgi:GTP-binding protein YchF